MNKIIATKLIIEGTKQKPLKKCSNMKEYIKSENRIKFGGQNMFPLDFYSNIFTTGIVHGENTSYNAKTSKRTKYRYK